MSATHTSIRRIAAPANLGLETRSEFRTQAITLLEEMPEGAGHLVVDLGATKAVDSAGLGALMLVQRRAAERRQAVLLEHASDELRFLLTLTKLDDLFEFPAGRR
jgi:ABC-type transporter Mla MlaB component